MTEIETMFYDFKKTMISVKVAANSGKPIDLNKLDLSLRNKIELIRLFAGRG